MKQLFSLLLLFTFATSYGQLKTNFTGHYIINKSKINFGEIPDWLLPTRFKVTQQEEGMTIVRTLINAYGTETDRTCLFAKGKPCDNATADGVKTKSTLEWNPGGTTFTIHLESTTTEGQPGQHYSEVWSLADDGKTLIIDKDVVQANGLKYSIKAYYDKTD